MADPRTFVLIGNFEDNITPALTKINNSIDGFKRNMASMATKRGGGYGDVTTAVGKLVSAQKHLKEAIEGVGSAARSATNDLKEYKSMMGKVTSAHIAVQRSGTAMGKSQKSFWQAAEKDLDDYRRKLEALQRQTKINPYRSMPSPGGRRGGGGYGGMMPPPLAGGGYTRPPRGGGGGGNRGGGGMSAHMAEFGFAYTLGTAISQPIQGAIVQGFQIGIGMMTKPFQYFANAFGERVQDELSDLKAAGGFLSISRRMEEKQAGSGFLKNMDEAIEFQQQTNKVFANMAKTLPGVTNDFVQVGKRLGDTIARTVNNDFEGARQMANQIRQTEEGGKFFGREMITGTGPEAKQQVITTLLGDLTKTSTLAGLGGRSGAGGIAGAYGLPGLVERMVSQDQVSMGQFQRYAAVFSDPTISDALSRNIDKINATAKDTPKRLEAMRKLLSEVVTPDLIEKLRISVDGVYQGLKATFLDPDTGLFGLGRQLENFGRKLNAYGQYVDEAGNVVDDITKAAKVDLSLFEIVRDIFSNIGQALLPLAEALPLIFDPIKKVADILMDARHYAAEFNRTFNQYREFFLEFSKNKSDAFKGTVDVRASLAAINNLLAEFGVISEGDFKNIALQLESENLDIGKMMSTLIDKVLNSKIAGEIGKMIGEIIGTVLVEVAKVTGFISGRVASSNQLMSGLKAGFNAAGGAQAFKNIFMDIFKTMFKALVEIAKVIPMEGYLLMGAMLVIPAAIQGLGMKIAESVLALITRLGNVTPELLNKGPKKFFLNRGKTAYTSPIGPTPARPLTPSERLAGKTRNAGPTHLESGLKPRPGFKGFVKGALGVGGKTESILGAKVIKSLKTTKDLVTGEKSARAFAKGLPVRIVGATKSAFTSMGGGGIGGGIKNLFGKGMTGLGKFGGIATAGVGIVEAIMALLSGDSLGQALGKGAGPVIGTIIGTALLGPLGGVIGGMIGSMEEITEPLGAAFESVIGTLGTTFEFLGQIGNDLLGMVNGFVRMLPGVSKDFDMLRFAVTALTAPFRLLELMIIGLYEGYLRFKEMIPGLGLTAEEKRKKDELFIARMEKTAALELDFKQAYNAKARAEYQKELDNLRAQGKGNEERARIVTNALDIIDAKLKQKDPKYKPSSSATPTTATTTTSLKPLKPGALNNALVALGGDPNAPLNTPKLTTTKPNPPTTPVAAAAAKVPTEVQQTAQSTSQINQKAATQVIQAASIQKSTAEAKNIAQTSGVTLGNIRAGIIAVSNKLSGIQSAILGDLNNIQAGVSSISSLLSSGNLRVKTDFNMPGGLPGGGSGGPAIFGAAAQKFGLQMTSGYRPGDPGYHGINRARDYSNGSGPTPQMMAFAQYLYGTFGRNLKELIYTPLGFSVKNGQKVPPYAQAAHYNHVHVAWAFGPQNGVGFDSQKKAEAWERSVVPGSVKVASITSNSAEGLGSTTVTNNITITQQPGQSMEQLAYAVAYEIGKAVNNVVDGSILT